MKKGSEYPEELGILSLGRRQLRLVIECRLSALIDSHLGATIFLTSYTNYKY